MMNNAITYKRLPFQHINVFREQGRQQWRLSYTRMFLALQNKEVREVISLCLIVLRRICSVPISVKPIIEIIVLVNNVLSGEAFQEEGPL
jgi:hypothetical protein